MMVGTTPRATAVDELTLDESTLKALLSRFVAIPSVSSDPRLRPRCWDAAKFAEAVLMAVGAECKMVQVRRGAPRGMQCVRECVAAEAAGLWCTPCYPGPVDGAFLCEEPQAC
jgi:hypothetical protein